MPGFFLIHKRFDLDLRRIDGDVDRESGQVFAFSDARLAGIYRGIVGYQGFEIRIVKRRKSRGIILGFFWRLALEIIPCERAMLDLIPLNEGLRGVYRRRHRNRRISNAFLFLLYFTCRTG